MLTPIDFAEHWADALSWEALKGKPDTVWDVVRLDQREYKWDNAQLDEWLDTYVGDYNYGRHICYDDNSGLYDCFIFRERRIAVLFKLTWG